jgi:hypothetical protein
LSKEFRLSGSGSGRDANTSLDLAEGDPSSILKFRYTMRLPIFRSDEHYLSAF